MLTESSLTFLERGGSEIGEAAASDGVGEGLGVTKNKMKGEPGT